MGNVKPKTLPGDPFGFDITLYIDCLKSASEMEVTYNGKDKKTEINFRDDQGDLEDCQFVVDGNPYKLKPGDTKTFPVDFNPLANPITAAAGAMLTGFTFGTIDDKGVFHPTYQAQNLKAFSASDFIDILTTLPTDQSYQRFVGLLDGPTTVTGTKFTDRIETGTGTDTVDALGGNDFVNKWQAGDLTYHGGGGFDTLDFETSVGVYFPVAKTQTLVLDLKTGEGLNPYGGTIKVDSVEKVIGTDAADKIYGSDGADWIETQDYGADLVKARGGNDTVVLGPFANGAKLDGGAGKDTLNTAFEFDQNTLDLTDPSKNTGKFEHGVIKNFEVFNFYSTSFDPLTLLTFKGTAKSETVNMSGARTVILDLGNGDNKAQGGSGDDTISAGSGKDHLNGGAGDDFLTGGGASDLFVFSLGFGHDVIKDFDTSGKDHDRIDLSAITDIKSWTDLKAHHLTSVDGNATIETVDDNSIILTSVKVKNLEEGDFIFG